MKILYNVENNIIYARIKDEQWLSWARYNTKIDKDGKYWILHKNKEEANVHLPLTLLSIAENEVGMILCRNILWAGDKTDSNNDHKHYVEDGQVKEKAGWEEYFNYSFKNTKIGE